MGKKKETEEKYFLTPNTPNINTNTTSVDFFPVIFLFRYLLKTEVIQTLYTNYNGIFKKLK